MNWQQLFRRKSLAQMNEEAAIQDQPQHSLKRVLGFGDLTVLSIAAILGAGIFSTIGNAAASGGPAVVFLFVFTAIACGFCALCYAEFASMIPLAGSAYTYAYASFGELVAWIIGWDLLLEYAIGDIAIAISWSQYLSGLLAAHGWQIPSYFSMDALSAYRGFQAVQGAAGLASQASLDPLFVRGYEAWTQAPRLAGVPLVCDLPALVVISLVTAVVFFGMEESKKWSRWLVALKMTILAVVIVVGAIYVNPQHWLPFAPHGLSGVLKGVSSVFFAYIGFDAIATTAEECKNPQRDLPRAMIFSLLICTVLYVALALILTGLVDSSKLAIGDPLAYVFGPQGLNMPWMFSLVGVGALIALSTVLLVFQLGQTRIWMVMSRDGLLPGFFCQLHPRYRTPWIATLVAGCLVAVPSLFLNLTEVTDLNSIGTLFAFMIVCAGSLQLGHQGQGSGQFARKFRVPYVNSRYLFPPLTLAVLVYGCCFKLPASSEWSQATWGERLTALPSLVFAIEMIVLTGFSITRQFSLIPLLGLTSCSYLMTELGIKNWIRFAVWLLLGGLIYARYGFRSSKLAVRQKTPPQISL